jgi:hypothetical protein
MAATQDIHDLDLNPQRRYRFRENGIDFRDSLSLDEEVQSLGLRSATTVNGAMWRLKAARERHGTARKRRGSDPGLASPDVSLHNSLDNVSDRCGGIVFSEKLSYGDSCLLRILGGNSES